MIDFFNSLSGAEATFWYIAIPASLIFLGQMVMTFIGMDGGDGLDVDFDGDLDVDSDGDSGGPFQMFTFRNLIAFLTVFSWTGIVCLDGGMSTGMSIFVGAISGLAMTIVLSSIFYFTAKLQSNPTPDAKNAIGRTGTVYLKIKANGQLGGKINVVFGGAKRTIGATTNGDEIPTGSTVTVVAEGPSGLVVEPVEVGMTTVE